VPLFLSPFLKGRRGCGYTKRETMSGVFWLICIWGAIAVSLMMVIWRIWSIMRLPIHLRWELAPIPGEKGRRTYGGSYLEEYEWWTKSRKRFFIAPVVYMAKEIILMHGVWKGNRGLWPFSITLHWGIYLFVLAVAFQIVLSVVHLTGAGVSNILLKTASVLSVCGYLLGVAATIAFILKRLFDRNLAWSNTVGTFVNLMALCAVYASGGIAWMTSSDWSSRVLAFIGGILSFDRSVTLPVPFALHVFLFFGCCLYLPLTSMAHVVIKYFMYHHVRWDDRPQTKLKEQELAGLFSQRVGWRRIQENTVYQKTWSEVITEE
jgi:nitrate reductase gamma subunit